MGVAGLTQIGLALWALSTPGAGAAAPGDQLFLRCAVCHQPDARGIPGMFPRLAERLGVFATTAAGRCYLVMVLSAGLMGEIEVDGGVNRGVMPGQPLDAQQIADVLNHVMRQFNGASLPAQWEGFSAEEVRRIIARYPGATGQAVAQLREQAVASLVKAP